MASKTSRRRQPMTVSPGTRVRSATARPQVSVAAPSSVIEAARPAATRAQHLAERNIAEELAPAAASPQRVDRADLGLAVGLGVAAFILYALTAARYPVTGDTPELITVANILGVAHAPGYPLLTMTGHLFGLMPIGSYAYRLSLFSAACSAGCVAMVYLTVRLLTPNRPGAVCASLGLALTPVFWQWSLQFEVFGLANLLAATLVYLLVRWYLEPTRHGFLIGAAFVFGLAMTNHQTIAFVVPAILWLLWQRRATLLRARRVIGYGALALLTGLLPYVYVLIAAARHPALNWDDPQNVGNLYNLLSRKDYGSGFQLVGGGGLAGGNPMLRFGYLLGGIGVVIGLLALVGLVYAFRECRWYFWFAVLCFAVTGVLFQILANVDTASVDARFVLERFFLLPLVLLAPLAGLGVSELAQRLARRGTRQASISIVLAVAALTLSSLVGALHYSTIDLSHDKIADRFAHDILSGLPKNDILLALGDEAIGPLWYVHFVEHVRPDVSIVLGVAPLAGWSSKELGYQGLKVPPQRTILSFREANIDRPLNVLGVLSDSSMNGKFYVYRDGLTFDILPQAVDKSPDQLVADNDAKLARYHIPTYAQTKHDSFENTIVADYGAIAYSVGDQFRQLKLNDQALTWFQRAADIDPHNPAYPKAIADLPK